MKQFIDLPYALRFQARSLTKKELKRIRGAAEGMDSFENGINSECLSTFCNSTQDCAVVHCRSCEANDSNGGICIP